MLGAPSAHHLNPQQQQQSVRRQCHSLFLPCWFQLSTMKYVVVSGGVVSGLGKGVTISSVGRMLQGCGLRVTSIKIDPYLNVDAGTMSPFEHGEVRWRGCGIDFCVSYNCDVYLPTLFNSIINNFWGHLLLWFTLD